MTMSLQGEAQRAALKNDSRQESMRCLLRQHDLLVIRLGVRVKKGDCYRAMAARGEELVLPYS